VALQVRHSTYARLLRQNPRRIGRCQSQMHCGSFATDPPKVWPRSRHANVVALC
jgi:hypothetical protein